MDDKRLISFDLDGTLVDPEFNEWVWGYGIPELYAVTHGIDFQKAKECVIREYNRVGDGCIEWYDISYWFKLFGLNGNTKELMYRFKNKIRVYPEVPHVLNNLNRKYDLIVTSNAAREFLEMELSSIGLGYYFKQAFSATSDFKQVKKTPEFYEKVCRLMEVKPCEVIHVGDHWEFDYVIPSKLGMCCFFIERHGSSQGEFVIRDLKGLEQRLAKPSLP